MSKKRLLKAMEGKHHDKKPRYTRKGREAMRRRLMKQFAKTLDYLAKH